MDPEIPKAPEEALLKIQPKVGLAQVPDGASSALSEIINRSLVHIQTSKALEMLHRIGEYELYGPDYRLVCALAEEVLLTPEEVLRRLLVAESGYVWCTRIEGGRFKVLNVDKKTLAISSIPSIDGLVVEILRLQFQETLSGLDIFNISQSHEASMP